MSGVRVTGEGSLLFGPAKDRDIPTWPVVNGSRTWIGFVLQLQKHQMTAVAAGETRGLHVIVKQRSWRSAIGIVLQAIDDLRILLGRDRTCVVRHTIVHRHRLIMLNLVGHC